jgi:hypothetical protein
MSVVNSAFSSRTVRRRAKKTYRESNRDCPSLEQWQYLRHMVKRGRDDVLAKSITSRHKRDALEALGSIDAWLQSRFGVRFESRLDEVGR